MTKMRVLLLGLGLIVLMSVGSCAPKLPKKATSDLATGVGKLSASFTALEKSYAEEKEYKEKLLIMKSKKEIELDEKFINELKKSIKWMELTLTHIYKTGIYGEIEWKKTALEYLTILSNSHITTKDSDRMSYIRKVFAVNPKKYTAGSKSKQWMKFNRQYSAAMKGLHGYYKALSVAASGEDIDAELAALEKLHSNIIAIVETATAPTGFAVPVTAVLSAGMKLLSSVVGAVSEAQRYALIEESLKRVGGIHIRAMENILGISATHLQLQAFQMRVDGRFEDAKLAFNFQDPNDYYNSLAKLNKVMNELQVLQALADPAFIEGIADLAETHDQLAEDVRKRKGSFLATLQQLQNILSAAQKAKAAFDAVQKSSGN